MFFIGAPLGAIVKKGGLGMPVVISVVFFLMFWILSITGEKMAKEMVILPYQGMWISIAVLLPLGVFFTYKATTDSTMFNVDAYLVGPIDNFSYSLSDLLSWPYIHEQFYIQL